MSALLLAALLAQAQDTGYAPPVVGGNPTTSAEWPDVVLVDAGGSVCTGTLVGPRTVITAAHCGNIRSVVVGTNDYYTNQGTTYSVSRTNIHPNYRNEGYDISVLNLATSVTGVTPRPFAIDCAAADVVDGAAAWVVGYGSTRSNGGGNNSSLNEARLTIVDADCSEDPYCDSSMEPNGELFAGGNGVDTCFGDSGGPLYVESSWGTLLVGVTSRVGYEAATSGPACGPGGIYTRADTLFPWIQSVSDDVLTGPSCNEPPEIIVYPFGTVGNAGTYRTTYAIEDPDSLAWTYDFVQPTYGTVSIDGDELVFEGDGTYVGADSFTFLVTDDYGNTSQLEIPLDIVDGKVGCGCSNASGLPTLGLALFALIPLRRRR